MPTIHCHSSAQDVRTGCQCKTRDGRFLKIIVGQSWLIHNEMCIMSLWLTAVQYDINPNRYVMQWLLAMSSTAQQNG